jgi:hypothetical protein
VDALAGGVDVAAGGCQHVERRLGMPNATFKLPVVFARRMPDPIFRDAQRHIVMMRAADLPQGLPKFPNPRAQNIDRGIYKDVKRSLLNEEGTPNTFHLKNKGITLLADRVREIDKETYEVAFGPKQGIVDGAHTFDVVISGQEAMTSSDETDAVVIDQFVKLEILTGVPTDLWPEIAGGLNTAVAVQRMSLANLQGKFDWIRDLLADESYAKRIAFRENEADAMYDVRDIIVFMEMFNVLEFGNDSEEHPTRTYNNKAEVLESYLANTDKYKQLAPILKDILYLHDWVSYTARDLHNKRGGRAGGLVFVDQRKRGTFEFPFIDKRGEYRLNRAALFPILGAFRWMVQKNGNSVRWRGGFERVLEVWDRSGSELMRATQSTSEEYGRKLTALGKSRNHWSTLHSTVAKHELMSR